MAEMTSMKVGMIKWENWGDEKDELSNWSQLKNGSSFVSSFDCEFIIHCAACEGETPQEYTDRLLLSFSPEITTALTLAMGDGYDYLCFYK